MPDFNRESFAIALIGMTCALHAYQPPLKARLLASTMLQAG